jgi:2-(1,2-epoxy-1,2-dihydrophenyl)acetyl-CoA isomerase
MAYTQIGLTPDGSSTYYLLRIIGLRHTLELAITDRVLSWNADVQEVMPPFWTSDRRNSTAARRQSVDPTEASEAVV